MGSNNGSSEIVELEKSTSFRDSRRFDQAKMGDKDRKHQYLKDDINKLFAAIDIRSSRSLDLSDRFSTDLYQKNAEKKPMRGTSGSQSPGIGFSDPVSLKQALRRQSISHASEMAAMKRGSRPPSSPSLSESRKISSFSASHSAHSSPRFLLMSTFKNVDPTLNRNEIVLSLNKVKNQSLPPQVVPSRSYQEPKIKEVPVKSEENKILPSHLLATKKETKKQSKKKGISVKKKGRLQTLQSSKSPIKRTPRTKLIKKKEIHESPLTDSTSETICQRCQCHLSDSKSAVSNGRDSGSVLSVKFNNKSSKSHEQKGFSQSSDSSTGEQSSSKSTVSEESNLSRSSITIRPHMSKNLNWEAIKNVKKKHGFLELGHFSLLKKLGSGDIGTVYLADLIGTNSLFAIKVMDNDFLVRRRKMARAQTESEILRMLDHPFLPTLYAKFTSDNLLCLVMEFCPGGDLHVLRQKQRGRCFPEQAARFYVAEVLLALEYLHMLGIVYRDLKPENIMVREDGHIMLTDFDLSLRCSVNPTLVKAPPGIEPPRMSGPCAGSNCIDPFCASPSCKVSCFLSTTNRARKHRADVASHARTLPQLVAEPTEARSNSFVGTHEYLAPEIIKGEVHGSSVDWWTLGVFLYELLYGKTPFKGAGNEETLANVVMHGLKFPDSPIVSCQARDLIKGLLVKEPENRFGTETGAAEIKRHPFFEGLNWALIRCAVPPQVPEYSEIGVPKMAFQEKGEKYLEYSVTGEQLEFELF